MQDIYLIHDDQEGPESRQLFLEMAGYRVKVMRSGRACLELLAEHKPALVVTDVLIHHMTGFELCKQIRERFTAESLPVLMCTELYTGEVFEAESERVGAQGYYTRPHALDELVADIVRWIGRDADRRAESRRRNVA